MKYIFHNFINILRHYKASSLLNIVGMAVAFAAFYIILTQVTWGFGYNQNLEDGDRLYMLSFSPSNGEMKSINFSRPMAERIIQSASGVEAYGTATFTSDYSPSFYYLRDAEGKVRRFSALCQHFSQGGLTSFGFEAEQGSLADLSQPGSVAVSSSFASSYGLKVGDQLSNSPSGLPVQNTIVAIWRDKWPANSSPARIDMLFDLGDTSLNDWSEGAFPYVVKLQSPEGKAAFEEQATQSLYTIDPEYLKQEESVRPRIELLPFSGLYYRQDVAIISMVTLTGDHSTDVTLLAVAFLIILIAMINFINFFFALVPARVRSVNTYKIFGVSRGTLMVNFILESVGLVILSLGLSCLITLLLSRSSFESILSCPIVDGEHIGVMLLTVGIALAGAVAGSIYPALYITSFQPAMVLKGSFGSSAAGRTLRNVLIGVQYCISIALIISALFVRMQHNYMMHYDMGFERQCLITGTVPPEIGWWNGHNAAFEDRLRSHPDIVDLTWADGQIVNIYRMGWGREYKERGVSFNCYPVAYNFLDVMGIELVEGRNFLRGDEKQEHGVMIFNEQARDQYGITLDPFGPGHNGHAEVVGFCRDFRFRPLRYADEPFAFYLFGQDHSWRYGLNTLYVRYAPDADPRKVMDFIRKTALELLPEEDPDHIQLGLFDQELARKYEEEEKLSLLVTAFTFVAILLSLMGVFGLVFFETQHRSREIAVRRVMGASVQEILRMFCRKYSIIVLVCFALSAPLCWVVVDRYFSTFAYHMDILWWVFVVALVVVFVVTNVIVVVRSWHTACSNPVESIKSE